MMDKEKALEVLKHGMSTEIWGQRFYEQAASRTTSEDGKRVFQSLIDEEKTHLAILRGQYAAVAGGEGWVALDKAKALALSVDPTDIFPDAQAAEHLIAPDTTDEQALEMAMAFEKRGYEFYQNEARLAISPEAKAMWEYLAKAEDRHYAFLQETYEYLTTNGIWYFDEQERPIFYD